jgi:hypothetical protein
MSEPSITPLEKEIADIKIRQRRSSSNFVDDNICRFALSIAEARQEFEKTHPSGNFLYQHLIGFGSKSLVTFEFHNGQWKCYIPGYEKYGEQDTNLISLLNKFLHVT